MTPNYKRGQIIKFVYENENKTGEIINININGTIEIPEEITYNILSDNIFYKNIKETDIQRI